jgi:hypothetical protein
MCATYKDCLFSSALKLCTCVMSVVAICCCWCQLKASAPSSSSSRPPQSSSSSSASIDKARKAGAALSAAAAAAAASCGGKPAPGAAAAAGSSSSGSSGPRMFDVGSAGGYYTEKSPKLMLHEWCTQQKRPKPKYKAVAVDPEKGGGYRWAGLGWAGVGWGGGWGGVAVRPAADWDKGMVGHRGDTCSTMLLLPQCLLNIRCWCLLPPSRPPPP